MEKIIRSRQGYEESNMNCPWCGHEHDLPLMEKFFKRSGNKLTMMTTCDDCNKRMVVQKHKLGHFTLRKYIDYKKRRMLAAGWIQKKFCKIESYI